VSLRVARLFTEVFSPGVLVAVLLVVVGRTPRSTYTMGMPAAKNAAGTPHQPPACRPTTTSRTATSTPGEKISVLTRATRSFTDK